MGRPGPHDGGRRASVVPLRRLNTVVTHLHPQHSSAGAGDVSISKIPGLTLGAVVHGVSCAASGAALLDDPKVWQQIEAAFLEHRVLVFPNQQGLTEAEQIEFGRRFGRLEFEMLNMNNLKDGGSKTRTADLSEVNDGKPTGGSLSEGALGSNITPVDSYKDGGRVWSKMIEVNEWWHIDSTFTPVSAKAGLLYAEAVPSAGGATEFLDMSAAYDELDEVTKARIEQASCYHARRYSVGRRVGFFGDPVAGCFRRPLVKIHPETKRKSIFLASHSFGVPGLPREESRKLLDYLVEFASGQPIEDRTPCRCPRVYTHNWAPGDVVIWDNRCLMHRALPYDRSIPRVLRASRLAGDKETEGALQSPDTEVRAKILEEELELLKDFHKNASPEWDPEWGYSKWSSQRDGIQAPAATLLRQ